MAHSQQTKNKISAALSRGNHWRSYVWIVQDPIEHIYITRDVSGLCKKFELPYPSLARKAKEYDSTPIKWGKAKGWRVLKREVYQSKD